MKIQNFSLKFLDVMVGMVLGLGFQWWPNLNEPWEYVAFIFVYLDIVDYWIDYNPTLKRFPPKREIDVILDVAIMFALFLYIYSTQLSPVYFFSSFIFLKILDFFWLLSSKAEYNPIGSDLVYVNTWMSLNLLECAMALILTLSAIYFALSPIVSIFTFILLRVIVRIFAVIRYKKIHFA